MAGAPSRKELGTEVGVALSEAFLAFMFRHGSRCKTAILYVSMYFMVNWGSYHSPSKYPSLQRQIWAVSDAGRPLQSVRGSIAE